MSLLFGALYLDRTLEEVRESWRARLARLAEPRLSLHAWQGPGSAVRVVVKPRRGRRVQHRCLGRLVRAALGPEREELAEFWLLEPARATPGALRLEGAGWAECLEAIGQPDVRQVRLWSPMVCPGPVRDDIETRGLEYGLEMRQAASWTVIAVPHRKPEPPYPKPWQGNYGW
jgi:hypothetical protein